MLQYDACMFWIFLEKKIFLTKKSFLFHFCSVCFLFLKNPSKSIYFINAMNSSVRVSKETKICRFMLLTWMLCHKFIIFVFNEFVLYRCTLSI